MLASLLSPPVAVEETWGYPVGIVLFPAEEAFIQNAVAKRRGEFARVRRCAVAALARLGHPPVSILPQERGEPGWPSGIVGSMTHCAGYAAAALAPADAVAGIGIDAEPNDRLPDGVDHLVCLPEERAEIARLSEQYPDLHWDRLIFSAKEAVYKTWFPLMRTWLDFEQTHVQIDPQECVFRAHLLIPGPVVDGRRYNHFVGRWAAADGLLVTAIVLYRRPGDDRHPTRGG